MSVTVRNDYYKGYVVEILDDNETDRCESWILLPAENLWNPILRGFLYILAIAYFFVGIAIASDIFMSAIEVITSKKRTIVKWDKDKNEKVEREVLVWNETVANLTLMALGSSAPEILLATIETMMNLGSENVEDSLGTFTIIGSAAFNLLIITAVCIVSVSNKQTKYICEFGVFAFTSAASLWAYVWMLIVVKYSSPDVIAPWEAWVTLLSMPLFVLLAYCTDNGFWCKKSKVDQEQDDGALEIQDGAQQQFPLVLLQPTISTCLLWVLLIRANVKIELLYKVSTAMVYYHYTNYSKGFVVEFLSSPTATRCESWLLLPAENLWHEAIRGFLYLVCMFYFFIGIAIASDLFMNSIEAMTSKEREVSKWDPEKNEVVKFHVRIWNETVANLTLMALGSSAPEIILATIEAAFNLGKDQSNEDSLGTFTIIGSAAFNLLIITSVCIVTVQDEPKKIREFGVFMITSAWSMIAYVWMLIVVRISSPNVITPLEAWITLGFMPVFVVVAYMQDRGWCCALCKDNSIIDDQHMRILTQRPRAGSFTGHILPGKELRVLEAERAEKEKNTKLSSGSEDSDTRLIHIRDGRSNEIDVAIEMESRPVMEKTEKVVSEQQHFARARFRHAVVSAMTGGSMAPRRQPKKPGMADVVAAQMKIQKAMKQGKVPEGDILGKFTFASDRYAVLESAGHLEVDILFHRNIPGNAPSGSVPNGDAVQIKNGNINVAPDNSQVITGVVSVEYETREGAAKAGKDFRYVKDTLVFKENEYKKSISIPIINDNEFENDVDFYLILKNPEGGTGLGDPSVARVTIVDDDEPGEFDFEQDHCVADLSSGTVVTRVIREHGFDGTVTIEYSTINGTASGGKDLNDSKIDYVSQSGVLTFSHGETSKSITVEINKNAKGPKNFIITLKNPSLGAKIGRRSAVVCNITKDELGDRLAEIVGEEEQEQTWGDQFVNAMTVGGGEDDDGNQIRPKWSDYVLHFLTFFWKIIGACVPPTSYLGAWPAFVFSLMYIGVLTMVVEQLGHLIGCVVGLETSITGITIIALGTSLPDTFASRTAAKQDEYADAAIGNVTGSNSVNVFLGLGIPWVLSTMYHLAKGTDYKVASDNLTQSVIIFSCVGFICLVVLVLRRKFVGGELGGKNPYVKWSTSIFLLFLWVIYIVLASLKATDILKWEV